MNISPENPQPSTLDRFCQMVASGTYHEGTALGVERCPFIVPDRVAALCGIHRRRASYAECARVILGAIEEREKAAAAELERAEAGVAS